MLSISTDWHFGKSNGIFDQIIYKGIEQQCIHAKENNIKILFNLGDSLDIKQTIDVDTLNFISKAYQLVSDTFDHVYVIIGNHDISKKNRGIRFHNLQFLNGYSNITIIDTPKIITINNKSIYCLPYFENEILKTMDFKKADYLFGHIEVQGFMFNKFIETKDGVSTSTISNMYDKILLGHFHKKQYKKNIGYIGNICKFFYGEDDEMRGWIEFDEQKNIIFDFDFDQPNLFKINLTDLLSDNFELDRLKKGDKIKLVIDCQIKFSELEQLKNKFIIDYGIETLLMEEQYFSFEIIMEDDGDDDEIQQDLTYMDYLLQELRKKQKHISGEVEHYLEEKLKNV